jgi:hypothetical protein
MLPGRSELELPQGREGGLPMPCIIHPPWTTFIHMVDGSHIEAGRTGSESPPPSPALLRRVLGARLCGWLGESRSFVRSVSSCGCGDPRWRGKVVDDVAGCWLRGRGLSLTSHLHQHLSFPSFSAFFLTLSLSLTLRSPPHPPPPSTYLFFT